MTETVTARPGFQINIPAWKAFDNAGPNPRLTEAVLSNPEYFDWHGVKRGRLYVEVKSDAALNVAAAPPPPSPFTTTAAVTMTNDRGETASGTITFRTTYDRMTPEQLRAVPTPAFTQTETMNAPPGKSVLVYSDDVFDDTGTNAKLTGAVFSAREYYSVGHTKLGMLWLKAKTAEQLNAMSPPPPSPFTTDVTVTMANDEGKEASGTITFRTTYVRVLR